MCKIIKELPPMESLTKDCVIFAGALGKSIVYDKYKLSTMQKDCENTLNIKKREAFEQLYNVHHKKIIYFAHCYIDDWEEARNIAHDVFVSLWKRRETVDFDANLLPFLYTCTKNSCLNYLRKQNYSKQYSQYTVKQKTDYLNMVALENTNSLDIYNTDVEQIFLKGINKMKPKVRHTFLLSRIKGVKNKQIAVIEGITESAVEARISSALKVMRKLLKDYL